MAIIMIMTTAAAAELDFSWRRGEVAGYSQTPAGGQPGSSSLARPDFAELGYNDAHRPRLALRGPAAAFNWQLQAERVRLDGRQTLQQDLISWGVPIPAGSTVDSALQFDWYSAGAGRPLWTGPTWQVEWQLALIGFDFDFQLDVDSGQTQTQNQTRAETKSEASNEISNETRVENRLESDRIHRDYGSKGLQAGLELRYALTDRLQLQLSGRRGYRAAHFLAVDDWALALAWRYSDLTLYGELGRFALRYRDHQELPNRLMFDQRETVGIGLRWQF
ncbi:hypothetical protein HPT27_02235 [Permianibacter sp. IMCC34836]|uniref:hypothetical protein n=1 Tax=Permianibacter fluminis TaxID=2738515 RepID=UPI001554C394|nr:hypothetical protein [Permianibacter fluminis]NQD35822.1 hypothetical protein [Permianibacter fluminis]